jgi:hypothetical protein
MPGSPASGPNPIRGRWTLWPTFVMPSGVVGEVERCCAIDGPNVPVGKAVEVVPVPDEQAIERAAMALASRRRPLGHGLDTVLAARIARQAREDVLVVLAAALEQPE